MADPFPRRLMSVVGARPNFMKLAPVDRALRGRDSVAHAIIHTGQHYDDSLSAGFFRELEIPEPDVNLGVGSGTHAQQTAAIEGESRQQVEDRERDVDEGEVAEQRDPQRRAAAGCGHHP